MSSFVLLAQMPGATASGTNTLLTNAVDWGRVLDSHFEKGELVFKVGPAVWIGLVLCGVGFVVWKLCLRKRLLPDFDVVEAELDFAKLGSIKIKPNHENIQIAHQAWVELSTRKAALPFDEEHDVVVEVYESYYQLFGRLRDLTKNIPAQRIRKCRDTKKLVQVMVKVLNQGLRPHLTRWQARFRSWYDDALRKPENAGKPPQEVQRQFKDYGILVADLKALQTEIVKYGEFLREIAQGKEE